MLLLRVGPYCAPVGLLDVWRFCPVCRAELERGANNVKCPRCGSTNYASSVPSASALVLDDSGRVLLGRRAHDPDAGKWDVLGGFLEEGEHPLDGLRRELREETGLDVEPLEFFCATIDTYPYGPNAEKVLNLVWTARIVGGDAEPADDVAEIRFFAADELPGPDELAFEHVAEVLAVWKSRQQHA